jgi:hypothetical protein
MAVVFLMKGVPLLVRNIQPAHLLNLIYLILMLFEDRLSMRFYNNTSDNQDNINLAINVFIRYVMVKERYRLFKKTDMINYI